jgi:uncharacterized membrane protein
MAALYRPQLKIPLTKFEVIIEILCVLLLVILFAEVIRIYPSLPEKMVRHINSGGEPTAYGGKSTVFGVSFVNLGLYLLLTILNRYPHLFNYPVTITEENAKFQYQIARSYLSILKLSMIIIFMIVCWNIIYLSVDKSKTILNGTPFILFLLLLLIVPFIFYWTKAKRNS